MDRHLLHYWIGRDRRLATSLTRPAWAPVSDVMLLEPQLQRYACLFFSPGSITRFVC
ncbi:MAG: hypothetical protein ACOYM4_06980 [Nodosilinea sp.]